MLLSTSAVKAIIQTFGMLVQGAVSAKESFQDRIGAHPLRLANPDFSTKQQKDKVFFLNQITKDCSLSTME